MSDAWDFGVAAGIQVMRSGISYLKVDAPYVLEGVAFSLAILEGSILSNTLPDRRRLTLYPAVMLILRVLFDFISGASTMFALIGMAGTLGGLLLGPIFHSLDASSQSDAPSPTAHSKVAGRYGSVATPLATVHRVVKPSRPVTHHTVDIDPSTGEYSETSKQVLFTPAVSLRILDDQGFSSDAHSYTRVDESFDTDDTVRYNADSSAQGTIYQDASDVPGTNRAPNVKDHVRKLRAQAKNDDINRKNLMAEREQILQEGDVARAFLLKHQADSLKKSMQESDKEAAKIIFEYYNPTDRQDKTRIDVRGLQASEAVKFIDEALTDLQEAGGNVMTISLGRSKNTDGSGKGKIKPTIRQYAKTQGINVRETEDGGHLILSLPTLRSPVSYD